MFIIHIKNNGNKSKEKTSISHIEIVDKLIEKNKLTSNDNKLIS